MYIYCLFAGIRFNLKSSRIEELIKYKILTYSLTTFFGFGEVCCKENKVAYIGCGYFIVNILWMRLYWDTILCLLSTDEKCMAYEFFKEF
jgi:hypothetical protein